MEGLSADQLAVDLVLKRTHPAGQVEHLCLSLAE